MMASTPAEVVADVAGACVTDATTLCLFGDRFQVRVEWEDFSMNMGDGNVGTVLSDDTGTFWFVDPELPELYVKMHDGTALNGHYWVSLASLTDWEYTVTVTDLATSSSQDYTNPLGSFTSLQDTMAFPEPAPAQASPRGDRAVSGIGVGSGQPGLAGGGSPSAPCTPGATRLCLDDRRFQVEVDWVTPSDSGQGETISLSDHASFFWFFAAANVDLAVKLVDGGAQNGNFWFFYGAVADIEYTIEVIDTCTGASQSYFNAQGSLTSDGDFAAFPSSPNCNLFFDGFESGDLSAWTVP